jgi:hypothetical protein
MRVNMEMANQLRDLPDLQPNEVVHRLTELERTHLNEGNPDIAANKRVFDQVQNRAIKHLEQRESDPGGAVEGSHEVQSLRAKMIGGVPRSKVEAQMLAERRLTAQARLGIDADKRSPISMREADALATTLGGMSLGDAEQSIKKLHARVENEWGNKYSGLIVRRVIEHAVQSKGKSEQIASILTDLDNQNDISPTTVERIKTLAELGRRERELSPTPQPKPASPGIIDRIRGMLPNMPNASDIRMPTPSGVMRGMETGGVYDQPPASAKVYPSIDKDRDIPIFKAQVKAGNPAAIRMFDETFGEGSAEKVLPGVRRLMLGRGIQVE